MTEKKEKDVIVGKEEKNMAVTEELINSLIEEDDDTLNESNVLRSHIYKDKHGENYIKVDRNSSGQPFSVSRFEDGEWQYGLNKKDTIPYKLPELIKAVAENEVIFITNGEKDSDTLTELGFSSTTAPFNSKYKWKREFNYYIKNAVIIILKDLSINGQEFADTCKKTACFGAKTVKTLLVENIAQTLGLDIADKTDITEIRENLQDDEKLVEILQTVVEQVKEKRK